MPMTFFGMSILYLYVGLLGTVLLLFTAELCDNPCPKDIFAKVFFGGCVGGFLSWILLVLALGHMAYRKVMRDDDAS